MKTKKFFWLLGTLALVLGLVLAGCENDVSYYTVTFSRGEGGGTPPANMTVRSGTTITLPGQGDMTAPEGKPFQGWQHSGWGGEYPEGRSVTIWEDSIFTAVWAGPYMVSFSAGEGGGTPPASMPVAESGASITLPGQGDMTPPEGKIFQGWSSSQSFQTSNGGWQSGSFQAGDSVVISFSASSSSTDSSTLFTAIWASPKMVAFYTGNGGGTPPESIPFEPGDSITLPGQGDMTPPTGSIFQGWRSDSDYSTVHKAGDSVTISSSSSTVYFTAVWVAGNTVTFSTGEGGGTPPENMAVESGKSIVLPGQGDMTAPAGKAFKGWRSNSTLTEFSAGDTVTVNYNNFSFTATWKTKKYTQEGIYVSLLSFADNATILNYNNSNDFVFLDNNGEFTLSNILDYRYSIAPGSGTLLFYGAHKALANLTANESEFPTDTASVNLITFTDGLDQGSFGASNNNPIEGQKGVSDYAAYVHDQIGNRKINGTSITAYSVGVKGSDVGEGNDALFNANLANLASAPGNVATITDFNQLETVFSAIADSMTVASHFSMTTPQNSPGTMVRMTFDATADATSSTNYLEGALAYSGDTYTLTNITYGGSITSDTAQGESITGTKSGINVTFLFRNIKGYDPATVQQWIKLPSYSWNKNTEYSVSDSTTTATVLVQLALDASISLNSTQIGQIRSAVKQFINDLHDRITSSK